MKTCWEFRGEGLGKKAAITETMAELKGSTIILTKGVGMDAALMKAAERPGSPISEVASPFRTVWRLG